MDRESLHKEIDLIQACINRMASNSFLLKGWMISIIAVVLALGINNISPVLLFAILLIPIVSFWYLDSYFLRIERMYRRMYEWVLLKRKCNDESFQYDLNPHRFAKNVDSIWMTMWSVTLRWFYGIPLIITLGIMIWRLFTPKC